MLSLLLGIRLNGLKSVVGASSVSINAEQQGMKGNNATDNAPILQQILKSHDYATSLTINIPKGEYLFTNSQLEAVKLRSNLTFNFEEGATFKIGGDDYIAFAYPSPQKGYNGGIKNVTWNNATFEGERSSKKDKSYFVQSIHHASSVIFNNATFFDCQSDIGHYLDINGSRNIRVNNSTFKGFSPEKGAEYKEAVQVDHSNLEAMSYNTPGDKYDNLPSYNIYVTNSKFLPIMNTKGSIKAYAPNPIGQHAYYANSDKKMIRNIYLEETTYKILCH